MSRENLWLRTESFEAQERIEVSDVEQGHDGSRGVFGSYYALETGRNRHWVANHAITDPGSAEFYARAAAEFLGSSPSPTSASLLDAGCGPGALTEALRQRLHCRAVGIDGSEWAIAYARRTYPSCSFKRKVLEENTEIGEGYDWIHAREFYIFTRSDDLDLHAAYLALFARHLKPGGTLLLAFRPTQGCLTHTLARLAGKVAGLGFEPFRSAAIPSAKLPLPLPLGRDFTRIVRALLGQPCPTFFWTRKAP